MLFEQILALGWQARYAIAVQFILVISAIAILSLVANYLIKRFIVNYLQQKVKKSQFDHFRLLAEHHIFRKISHLAPSLVVILTIPLIVVEQYPFTETVAHAIQLMAKVYLLVVTYLIVNAFIDYGESIYKRMEVAKRRPIKSYLQVVKIVLFVIVIILAIAILLNKSPFVFLTGLGAMAALVSFMLKDSILGFIASIQLTSYDMVRIGDWIEMPTFGADGDVIDMSLNTIKVQNFDKTIVTIPTPALLHNELKNWRGMNDAGGRRIKRAIYIDIRSIQFCDMDDLPKYRKMEYLRDYLDTKVEEIKQHNEAKGIDKTIAVNGRHLTNIGLFRIYLLNYLKGHPRIRQDLTLLVRQLDITDKGLPIEIYVFTNTVNWAAYESIQADIFDHILAVLPYFNLHIYQSIIERQTPFSSARLPVSDVVT